jgi:hypothetical protein|tara:strand:- start:272 stop:478 length:207 start_codon:yes stop_codon:yes gene_type:complete
MKNKLIEQPQLAGKRVRDKSTGFELKVLCAYKTIWSNPNHNDLHGKECYMIRSLNGGHDLLVENLEII